MEETKEIYWKLWPANTSMPDSHHLPIHLLHEVGRRGRRRGYIWSTGPGPWHDTCQARPHQLIAEFKAIRSFGRSSNVTELNLQQAAVRRRRRLGE